MVTSWWVEIAKSAGDPWEIGYSEPACRRLAKLDSMADAPDLQPLKDLLVRLRQTGVPATARRIQAAVPIFRVQEGDFRLQVHVLDREKILSVERLSHPALV